ncbi:D-alanyl-D-alanine carboxypeptidase/D-alanyl-D-alanine-endopeptidase [Sporosarcina sp. G11-34]|nr:D-alanyl-D-alanine carboxypeptidase/D-alanyl-D-alanine-endopeptidase [Sporosarcina sp. G11-34]
MQENGVLGGLKALKRKGLVNSLVVLLLIVLLAIIPFGKKQLEHPVIASNNDAELVGEINKLLTDPRVQGATTSVSIRQASNGEVIYSELGDTRVHPASVMKLFTGTAALETLGQDYRFQTEVYTDGKIKKGVLHGNLYLRGKGDPTVTNTVLTALASDLKGQGIHAINGNVYGDDTWYDDVRLSQDLNWSDEPYYTGSQVSALTFAPNGDYDAGTVIVEVNPERKAGKPGIVRMVPENNYMKIINKTETVAKKGDKNIAVERLHGSNTLVVSGTIPLTSKKTRTWASVWEPTDYTIRLFVNALQNQKITFASEPEMERGIVPKDATQLVMKQSMPLKDLFIPFMKLSNNGHGEVLVKEMGKAIGGTGSWDKGLAVMEGTLADFGVDTKTMLLRDGSGMSHKNLVTTNEVTKLLYIAQTKSWYPAFLDSLPVAGADERFIGGTLRKRMKGTAAEGNVLAKTGTLNGVTALSGYVTTKSNETLIFSVIVNNHLNDTTYEVLDQIAIALANYNPVRQ